MLTCDFADHLAAPLSGGGMGAQSCDMNDDSEIPSPESSSQKASHRLAGIPAGVRLLRDFPGVAKVRQKMLSIL